MQVVNVATGEGSLEVFQRLKEPAASLPRPAA